uniref:Uncharacterized protein n=1 Tax=Opuntia streptacantha TaxID=393608 RepID=A0A7C9CUE2_OPUST
MVKRILVFMRAVDLLNCGWLQFESCQRLHCPCLLKFPCEMSLCLVSIKPIISISSLPINFLTLLILFSQPKPLIFQEVILILRDQVFPLWLFLLLLYVSLKAQ